MRHHADDASNPPAPRVRIASATGTSGSRAALSRTRDRLRAQLDELAAELDDLARAVTQERCEQALGIPSLALPALLARLCSVHATLLRLRAVLAQVEALCIAPGYDLCRHADAAIARLGQGVDAVDEQPQRHDTQHQ